MMENSYSFNCFKHSSLTVDHSLIFGGLFGGTGPNSTKMWNFWDADKK